MELTLSCFVPHSFTSSKSYWRHKQRFVDFIFEFGYLTCDDSVKQFILQPNEARLVHITCENADHDNIKWIYKNSQQFINSNMMCDVEEKNEHIVILLEFRLEIDWFSDFFFKESHFCRDNWENQLIESGSNRLTVSYRWSSSRLETDWLLESLKP